MPREAGVTPPASSSAPPQQPRHLRWPLWWPVCRLRGAILRLVVFPLLRVLYRIDVSGAEQFDEPGACVVIANHCSHLDNALILAALPASRRRRLAIAAAADTIFKRRGNGMLAALLGNAFPVARGGGTARSVEYCSWLLDRGWSVLLYPEGRLTVGGPIQPFRHGIGVIATATSVPIVPLRIQILRRGVGEGRRLPWRGHVAVHVGAPWRFRPEVEAEAAVKILEGAVARAGFG